MQSTVDQAVSGDVVVVKPGTYTENIRVTIHNLVIKSESGNPTNTIIAAKDSAIDVFTVESEGVTISGFKITGAKRDHAGIYLYKCKNCIIENDKLLDNSIGISLKNSDYNFLRGNLIGRGEKGVNVDQSNYNTISGNRASKNIYGIYLPNSKGNILLNNTLSNNKDYGILLSTAEGNTLSGNEASNNGRGIHLGNSDNNRILDNTIFLNEVYGLFICPKSDRNQVFNNYLNNTFNVQANNGTGNVYTVEKTAGLNIVGGPYLAGNFWAKPDGLGHSEITPDADRDGIADEKYSLENSDYVDRLPLVALKPQHEFVPVTNFSSNITSGNAPLAVLFTDLSENEVERGWDFENDGNVDSPDESPVHTFASPGTYTVNLTAGNEKGSVSKLLVITVTEGNENKNNRQNGFMSLPGFELIYGILGFLAVSLYKKR
ncbi:MAG: PKD domain-containing protein [Clostridiales bacterium]|nr:PKD domain-containing protein [Clostridiales bacterium]